MTNERSTIMFPNYKGKLVTIMWMGVSAAILSSIFSIVIIALSVDIKKRVKQPLY